MATSRTSRKSGRPRTGGFSGRYQVVHGVELAPEEEAEVQRHIEQLEGEKADISTALRWGRTQLAIVRRAAGLAGVPYQTYLKQAAIRSAIDDLRAARAAGLNVAEQQHDQTAWTLVLGEPVPPAPSSDPEEKRGTRLEYRFTTSDATELLQLLSDLEPLGLPADKAAILNLLRKRLELLAEDDPRRHLTGTQAAADR